MTKEQTEWADRKVKQLMNVAIQRMPMSDSDWKELQKSVEMIFIQSKKNTEVRDVLVKFLSQCEKKDEEARRLGKIAMAKGGDANV